MKAIYRLDIEPIADWLSKRIEAYGGIKPLAEKVEEDYVWLTKVVNREFKTIDIDKADKILCLDDTTHLRELYPELYEE